ELDPDARAHLRQHHHAMSVAGERRGGQGPAARLVAEHGRHRGADAALVIGVVDVGDDAAVLAVIGGGRALDQPLDGLLHEVRHQKIPPAALTAVLTPPPSASATAAPETSVTESVLASSSWL